MNICQDRSGEPRHHEPLMVLVLAYFDVYGFDEDVDMLFGLIYFMLKN